MSTLMSKDINLTRPSTRLHAPPGGQSNIFLGDYSAEQQNGGKDKKDIIEHTPIKNGTINTSIK